MVTGYKNSSDNWKWYESRVLSCEGPGFLVFFLFLPCLGIRALLCRAAAILFFQKSNVLLMHFLLRRIGRNLLHFNTHIILLGHGNSSSPGNCHCTLIIRLSAALMRLAQRDR